MLIFAPSFHMFKTSAEHTTDIAPEYKLAHRKVYECICKISRHNDTHLNFKKYTSTMIYLIYLITFSMMNCPMVVRSLLDVLRFYIMVFNDEEPIIYASPPSLALITLYSHYICILYIFWVVAINIYLIWFNLILIWFDLIDLITTPQWVLSYYWYFKSITKL